MVKTAIGHGCEVFGVADGFEAFFTEGYSGVRELTLDDVRGILPRGGTILGTTNRGNPFRYKWKPGEEQAETDRSQEIVEGFRKLRLDALVVIGGDGSLRIAHELAALGLPVVGVPKTIDNDLSGTDVTFGFDTALTTAMEARRWTSCTRRRRAITASWCWR